MPDTVNMLKEKLANELKPVTRIVSHNYPLTGWLTENMKQFDLPEKEAISGVKTTIVWLYVVPAKVAGRWNAQMPPAVSRQPATLQLRQQLTRVSGSVVLNGEEGPLEDVKLRGNHLSFKLAGRKGEFTGQVKGGSIEGTLEAGGAKTPWSGGLSG